MEYKEIKKLMDDMGNSKLTEIDIEFPDGVKISMKKGLPSPKPIVKEDMSISIKEQASAPSIKETGELLNVQNKSEVLAVKEQAQVPAVHEKVIKSPIVGTFYSKMSESDEPYVNLGSMVKKGDIVCIIEAMKLMNEIESDLDGEIVEILCKDGDMVEYGQPLFKLK